ncbi:MAG: hypothetical protein ACRDTS_04880 [Mycobacterium sp.]
MHTTPDGTFVFDYKTPDGKTVQVHGQLTNGTGNFFDENTQTTYMFRGSTRTKFGAMPGYPRANLTTLLLPASAT